MNPFPDSRPLAAACIEGCKQEGRPPDGWVTIGVTPLVTLPLRAVLPGRIWWRTRLRLWLMRLGR